MNTAEIVYQLPHWDRRCNELMQGLVRRLADDCTMTPEWVVTTGTECAVLVKRLRDSGVLNQQQILHSYLILAAQVMGKAQAIRMMLQTFNEIGE